MYSRKIIVPLLLLCAFQFDGTAQEKIKFGKEQCTHCRMIIKDQLHVAQAIDKKGNIYSFDAIECLINYLKENREDKYQSLLVSDYSNRGKLIEAKTALYLKSKSIPSPMGAFLSAFQNRHAAEQIKSEKGGEIFNWEEIKEKFKDSNFGLQMHQHFRPDAYAPMGVMGDHLHHKGGIMANLKYMNMTMSGTRSGNASIDAEGVLSDYMVAPEKMNMDMYMLGVMYAPSGNLTLMLMQNFMSKKMGLVNRMGNEFQTEAKGFGDLKFSLLYNLIAKENHSVHLNSGVSFPMGKTDVHDDTPMATDAKLPYAMQLGSGTYDFLICATYKGNTDNTSWGIQQRNTLRSGQNSQGYRFGNQYEINAWGAIKALDWMSLSVRVNGSVEGDLIGVDSELNPMMVPSANPNNYGNQKFNAYVGANFSFSQQSILKRLKFGIEYGIPVYQQYNGIQMNEKSTLQLGLRYTSL